jgi:PKD repeat protein
MTDERAMSETVAIILILCLVIVMAAIVLAFATGIFSNLAKPAFVAPSMGTVTQSGKVAISLFNRGGDTLYLDVPRLQYNTMSVYLDTPNGTYLAHPAPDVGEFSPGTTLYIYKTANGYLITRNLNALASPDAQSLPQGTITVRLVDDHAQTLISSWSGTVGATPSPTPTPTPPVPPAPVVASFTRSPVQGVVPLTVSFTDTSTGPVTSGHWSLGDGGIFTERNLSHTYAEPGWYTVTLVVTNATGGSSTLAWDNCVKGILRAAFSGEPFSGTAPLTVRFTDQTYRHPTSWSWDFGDGDATNATEKNPVHTFSHAGTFTVSLTASDPQGADTVTKPGYVTVSTQPVPVAGFSATPRTGTAPLTVSFTDTSTNMPTAWSWNFGDGDATNSTQKDPVHRYASAGSYDVTLTTTNAGGSSAPLTVPGYITVNEPPLPAPVISWLSPDYLRHGQSHTDVDVEGSGFVETGTTQVILRHAGDADIVGEWVKVLRPEHLIFDLAIPGSATPGDWNVVVINPDGQLYTLVGGFEVRD